MRLPNFLEAYELNSLRALMGADRLGDLKLKASANILTMAELETLSSVGVDIESLDSLRVLPDGTLAYKDSRVLVYIRDVSFYGRRSDRVEDLPKYHFANCETLQEMRRKRRSGRYVVASRKDGQFLVNVMDGHAKKSALKPLRVCQNCLGLLGIDGFQMNWTRSQRHAAVGKFKIERFFDLYRRSLLVEIPEFTSETAPLNEYAADHSHIAARVKAQRRYLCDECQHDFSAEHLRRFLHLHHINGQKNDNSEDNLSILCMRCHAVEHPHLKSTKEYREFLQSCPR